MGSIALITIRLGVGSPLGPPGERVTLTLVELPGYPRHRVGVVEPFEGTSTRRVLVIHYDEEVSPVDLPTTSLVREYMKTHGRLAVVGREVDDMDRAVAKAIDAEVDRVPPELSPMQRCVALPDDGRAVLVSVEHFAGGEAPSHYRPAGVEPGGAYHRAKVVERDPATGLWDDTPGHEVRAYVITQGAILVDRVQDQLDHDVSKALALPVRFIAPPCKVCGRGPDGVEMKGNTCSDCYRKGQGL